MGEGAATSTADTLGTPMQRYEKSGKGLSATVLTFFFGVLVGVVCLYGAQSPTSAADAKVKLSVMGAAALVLAVGAAGYGWLKRGLYVQVYSDGLMRVQAGKAQAVRWDDISAVWQSVTRYRKYNLYTARSSYIYTLQTTDKRTLEFSDDIKGIAKLGHTIQQEATKRLYPQMVAAYNEGQPVAFGAFSISKDGISYKNKSLSWAEVEGAQLKEGYVTFTKQGARTSWARVAAGDIPNLLTFLSLVDHVVGLKREQ